jgi:hypothetical protein
VARTLLRVAAGNETAADRRKLAEASALLTSHHGSAPPASMGRAKKYWLCHGKDHNGEACAYQVPCGKVACNSCGHQPPLHVSCPGNATAGKGGGKAGKGADATAGKGGGKAGKDTATVYAKLKAKDDELAKVKLQLAAAEKKHNGTNVVSPAGTGGAMAPAADPNGTDAAADAATANAAAIEVEIMAAQKLLDDLSGMDAACRSICFSADGAWEAAMAQQKAKIEECKARKRGLLSLPEQLKRVELYDERMAKKLAAAEKRVENKQKAIADLQAELVLEQEQVTKARSEKADAGAQRAVVAGQVAAQALRDTRLHPEGTAAPAMQQQQQPAVEELQQQLAELQQQLAQHTQLQQAVDELQAMAVDVEDIFSDSESVAPSGVGEIAEAACAKGMQDRAQRAEKRRRMGEGFKKLGGVATKFGKPAALSG